MNISVIIPAKDEEESIPELSQWISRVMESHGFSYEVIFIDDGSTDGTWDAIKKMNLENPAFKGFQFNRNFGKAAALHTGFKAAKGEVVITMDADLQDPPEVVLQMIEKWENGVDVVYGQRLTRQGETFFKKLTAKIFYRSMQFLSGTHIPEDTGDFRLMDKEVVHHLRRLREQGRFMRGLVSWVGFKQEPLLYDRKPRHSGTTNYPFFKMLKFAWEGITSFSVFPLRIATLTGIGFAFSGFLVALNYIFRKEVLNDPFVKGWVSIMVAILGVGGVLLLFIGILGEYLAKAFEELKERPLYIARESTRKIDTSL